MEITLVQDTNRIKIKLKKKMFWYAEVDIVDSVTNKCMKVARLKECCSVTYRITHQRTWLPRKFLVSIYHQQMSLVLVVSFANRHELYEKMDH